MAEECAHQFLIRFMLSGLACAAITALSVLAFPVLASPVLSAEQNVSVALSLEEEHTFAVKTYPNAITRLSIEEIQLSAKYTSNAENTPFQSQCFHKNLFKKRQLLLTREHCENCSISARAWTTHDRTGRLNYSYQVIRANTQPVLYEQLLLRKAVCDQLDKHNNREAAHRQLQTLQKSIAAHSSSEAQHLAIQYELLQISNEDKLARLQELRTTANRFNNTYAHTIATIQLGRYHNKRGEFHTAQKYFDTARRTLSNNHCCGPEHLYETAMGTLEHEQGQLYLISKQLEKALPHLQQAELHFSHTADISELVFALNTLGYYHRTKRVLPDAFAYHNLASQLLEYSHPSLGMEMSCAYFLGTIGILTGQYYYALELLDRAEHLAQQQNDDEWHGHTVAAIARAYRELGNTAESLIAYQTALNSYKKAAAKPQYITIYAHFAEIYAELGDVENSRKFLALSHAELGEREPDSLHARWLNAAQVTALVNEGKLHAALQLQQATIASLEQQSMATRDAFSLGRAYTKLASLYRKAGEFEKAQQAARQALLLQQENRDELYLVYSYFEAAQSALQQGAPSQTIHSFTNPALQKIEQLRANLHSDNLKRQYFNLQRQLYDVKVQSYSNDAVPGFSHSQPNAWRESLFTAESYKARTLLEAMLQNGLQKLQHQQAHHPLPLSNLQVTVAAGKQHFTELFNKPKQVVSATRTPFKNSTELSEYLNTLNPKLGLIFLYVAGSELVIWGYHAGHKVQHRIAFDAALQARLTEINRDLQNEMSTGWSARLLLQQHQRRWQLSQMLLGKLQAILENTTQLLIIADGLLHRIPFGLLPHPTTEAPLLTSHTISYQASLATDRWLQLTPHTRATPAKMLLVANPQLAEDFVTTSQWVASRRSGFSNAGSLPFALVEAEKIRALWPERNNSVLLSGPDATKARFLAALSPGIDMVHIASHAEVDWQYPPQSALLFTPEPGHSLQSGRFTAQEIAQLELSPALVVLSACSTGSGKAIAGEGPMALSRAFFEAGTRRVIASLWAVEDESTSYLFEQFYQYLLIEGLAPEESLRKAQLKMSQIPRWSHPYYWAGFVFMGKRNIF